MNKPAHKDQLLFIRAALKLQNMLSMFGKTAQFAVYGTCMTQHGQRFD
jgi:hypothetical protein